MRTSSAREPRPGKPENKARAREMRREEIRAIDIPAESRSAQPFFTYMRARARRASSSTPRSANSSACDSLAGERKSRVSRQNGHTGKTNETRAVRENAGCWSLNQTPCERSGLSICAHDAPFSLGRAVQVCRCTRVFLCLPSYVLGFGAGCDVFKTLYTSLKVEYITKYPGVFFNYF